MRLLALLVVAAPACTTVVEEAPCPRGEGGAAAFVWVTDGDAAGGEGGAGGQLDPDPECVSDPDCPPCGICEAGQCVPRVGLCRASAGPCDMHEICDGLSLECPVDGVRPAGYQPEGAEGPLCGAYLCGGAGVQCGTWCDSSVGCAPGYECTPEGACVPS